MNGAPCRNTSNLLEVEGRASSESFGIRCERDPSSDCLPTDSQTYDSDEDWRSHLVYSQTASLGQGSCGLPETPETWRFYGDFYHEDEDVYRSASCQPPEQTGAVFFGSGCARAATLPGSLASKFAELSSTKEAAAAAPREVSSLWPFTVAATHIKLQRTPPSQAWHQCVSALQQKSGVSIQKVRPQKYAVKAKFCASPGFQCEFKVFTYAMAAESEDTQAGSPAGAVLEFQRRSGDCLAFSQLFKHMRRLLNGEEEAENATDILDWKMFDCSRFAFPASNEEMHEACSWSNPPFWGLAANQMPPSSEVADFFQSHMTVDAPFAQPCR